MKSLALLALYFTLMYALAHLHAPLWLFPGVLGVALVAVLFDKPKEHR